MNIIYDALMDNGIVKEGHFLLASGRHSDKYVSKTKITTIPTLYFQIISKFISLVDWGMGGKKYYDVVTGPATAGIPFAAPMALNLGKIFVYPEKFANDYITLLRILCKILHLHKILNGIFNLGDYEMLFRKDYQDAIEDKKVIIIEDVITTGGSVIKTIKSIHKNGGEVVAIFCIWKRNPELFIRKSLNKETEIPIYSLISKKVESWNTKECPLCKKGVKLIDPKSNMIIEG